MTESLRDLLAAEDEFDVRDDELFEDEEEDVTRHNAPSFAPNTTYSIPPRSSALARVRRHVRPGEVVAGKYRVERRIGDSGLATRLQVRHLVLDESATLKYLRPEARSFPEAIAEFLSVARKLSQIRSSHVARVVDVGMLELGTPYMVTEQPNGPDLGQVVRVRGALPTGEAIGYLLQACEGVSHAYDLGVLHGGLCTESIFVCRATDGSQVVRLTDFATLAPQLTDVGSAGTGMLTARSVPAPLRYLSPEHARDPGHVDTRADVWALGAILHELLSGLPLFEDKTVPGLLARIVADAPTPIRRVRPEVPEELERLILRCVEKNRDLRFATASELALALRAIISLEVPVVASRASVPPPLPAGFEKAPTVSTPAPPQMSVEAKGTPAATPPPRTPARRDFASARPANPAPAPSKASSTQLTNVMLGVIALGLAALAGEHLFNKALPAAPVLHSAPVVPASAALPSPATPIPTPAEPTAAAAMPNPAAPNLPSAVPIAQAAQAVSVSAPAPSPPAPARRAAQPKHTEKKSETAAPVPDDAPTDGKPVASRKAEAPTEPVKPAKGSAQGLFDEKWWQ